MELKLLQLSIMKGYKGYKDWRDYIELYTDYLISRTGLTTATGLSVMTDGAVSHDQYTAPACQDKNAFSAIPSFSPHLA